MYIPPYSWIQVMLDTSDSVQQWEFPVFPKNLIVTMYSFFEKCFICDNHNDFTTNGTCENGLFHRDAGQMEICNALESFKRSERWGFRYTTMIADDDNKVFNYIEKHNQEGFI